MLSSASRSAAGWSARDDFPLKRRQQPFRFRQGQTQSGDVTETTGPIDFHDILSLPLALGTCLHQPQNPGHAPTLPADELRYMIKIGLVLPMTRVIMARVIWPRPSDGVVEPSVTSPWAGRARRRAKTNRTKSPINVLHESVNRTWGTASRMAVVVH